MGLFSRTAFGASPSLDKISNWLKNPNASEESRIWNYGRYAYITIKSTGNNNAGLPCSTVAGVILGDSKPTTSDDYNTLIVRDGNRDVPSKPILESVRINNDGSTDVTEAVLFSIDVGFKCFSASQFKTYENAFFTTGNEAVISFGYKDLGMGGEITANVHNFSFSMDASGVYSCQMQLTGKNRFAAVLGIGQSLSDEGTTVTDKEGNEIIGTDIPSELEAQFITAFPEFEESSPIQLGTTKDFVEDGKAKLSGNYAIANIQTKGFGDANFLGLNIDLDDKFVKYVTFEGLIQVINKAHNKSGFSWGFGEAQGKFINEFASADPAILLLDGEMANYGGTEDGDTVNELQTGTGFKGDAQKMLISLDFVTKTLRRLEEREKDEKDAKGETSVNNFLRVVLGEISELTGGLYQLVVYNDTIGADPGKFLIVNERAEHSATSAGYTFTLHQKGSVLKSVNLSSNMDSEMAAAALVSNRNGGKGIPGGALDSLYGCGLTTSAPTGPTLEQILEKKIELGTGYSAQRVQTFKSEMASFVSSQPKKVGNDKGYRYMIDLDVTSYGVHGAKVGDTFTVSGLPDKYTGKGKYFAVGKVDHSFNGQGGWDTTFTGFLKLDII